MPRPPARPPRLRGRVFRGSAAVRAGLLTRHQVQSSAWRRLFPDVYACASLPVTHELRARAATGLLLPGAVASGRTAAVLWGVALAGPDDPVECVLPAASRAGACAGVVISRRILRPHEVTERAGSRVTTPVRTGLDLARIRPLDEAVVALDQFLRPGFVLVDELRVAATTITGRDCRHIREASSWADGLAESPPETRLRLLVHRSELPRPVAQYSVRHGGRFVARVDLGWPEHKVALEYEGAWHGEQHQVGKDRARLNRLTAAGWRVVFVTATDLRDPVGLVARVAAALRSSTSAWHRCRTGR